MVDERNDIIESLCGAEWRQKTLAGINNPLNLKRIKFSYTLIALIAIITLALVLESSTVSSLPTKSKSRRDKDHHHSHSHRHLHKRLKHHHHHQTNNHLLELEKPLDDDSSGSLSIVSPLDVLRKNMLMEMQKTRIRHAKNKLVEENREYLDRIG